MTEIASRMTEDMQVAEGPLSGLKLTNDGQLELYFIGAGSAFAKTLNQNNLLIIKGNDHLLVDCGTKCSQALFDVGLPVSEIRNFLITHSHADHIGGLEEVQLYGRYVSQIRPRMVINEEYETILWEQSLRGGSEMSESTPLGFGDLWDVQRPDLLPDAPRETWATQLGSIDIKMPRTKHFPDDAESWKDSQWSCGVIIDERILFTSDTRFDQELLQTFDDIYNFDIIFHDCQLFTGGVHASINELATLPGALKSRMVLMHYGDNYRDFEAQAQRQGFHSWARQGHIYRFSERAVAQG
ncbi:MAG: MBL fold metallo-hydrolase [Pseudomonadota bacterium]